MGGGRKDDIFFEETSEKVRVYCTHFSEQKVKSAEMPRRAKKMSEKKKRKVMSDVKLMAAVIARQKGFAGDEAIRKDARRLFGKKHDISEKEFHKLQKRMGILRPPPPEPLPPPEPVPAPPPRIRKRIVPTFLGPSSSSSSSSGSLVAAPAPAPPLRPLPPLPRPRPPNPRHHHTVARLRRAQRVSAGARLPLARNLLRLEKRTAAAGTRGRKRVRLSSAHAGFRTYFVDVPVRR